MSATYLTPEDTGLEETEQIRARERDELHGWLKDVLFDAVRQFPHLKQREIVEEIQHFAGLSGVTAPRAAKRESAGVA